MLKGIVKLFGGDVHKRTMDSVLPIVDQINALNSKFESLTDEELRAKTDEFRQRLADGETLDDLLPEAFATVRETAHRTIGIRHYDVQLIGGIILHRGQIAEMRTGEGKTLVATLPIYLNALTGKGVHLVTVNDYLARRDARWMAPNFDFLGLQVGILQMAAVTENGKKAFLYDPEVDSPNEDKDELRNVDRAEAYAADITYGTNSEFGFDYLRDNMAMQLKDRVQRGHYFAIVDEVDNVLIDEARTPLIISGPASGDLEWYTKMAQVVKALKPEEYEINEKDRSVTLTEIGIARVEQLLGQPLQDLDRPEDLTPIQSRLLGYLEQALRAQHLFRRNKEYIVQGGKVTIVDENTGRMMPGRRWSDGLHQAVEAKEGVRIEPESVTYATITLQNYFRMYEKLAGMSGTALTEAEEFSKIYNLEVAPILTNLEYEASRANSPRLEINEKDEDGYSISYFIEQKDKGKSRRDLHASEVKWRRLDYPDVIYRSGEAKLRAIVAEIIRNHVRGRPLLIGTTSVQSSEILSARLRADPIRRLLQALLIRHTWFEKNQRVEDGIRVPELEPLYVPLEKIESSQLRAFAKPLGLTSINLEDAENLPRLLDLLSLGEKDTARLKNILAGGIPHKVLNARKHTEESIIITGAGALGAVTIATSMAGRGVDIILGGDAENQILLDMARIGTRFCARLGRPTPQWIDEIQFTVKQKGGVKALGYGKMQFLRRVREWYKEILKEGLEFAPDDIRVYGLSFKTFDEFVRNHDEILRLGGLAVLATERHEARRIDNQLRGRSARQGDPGSSRFYLSLEDDLMRIQGGEQVSNMMTRLRVDEAYPLEARLVSNMIEQSQHRVEGANFDVRKHLLEYDDVLNKQRTQIYAQRDRIFSKEDLRDDVQEMLDAEARKRVEAAFEDEENFWRLPAWLEAVQPTFRTGEKELFPSFSTKVILDEFASHADPRAAALHLVDRTLTIEHSHLQRAIENSIERANESLEHQTREREDILDTFFAGLRDNEEKLKPAQILENLKSVVRLPIKLDNNQLHALANDPESIAKDIRGMVADQLTDLAVARLVGAVENRLAESLGFSKEELEELAWEDITDEVASRSRSALTRQRERLAGVDGILSRDVELLLQREDLADDSSKLRFLLTLSQGQRTFFDARTHRQVRQAVQRFNYSFLAAELMQNESAQDLIEKILVHLEQAEDALTLAWGRADAAQRGTQPEVQEEAKAREMGYRLLNESHRRLLLSAITDLWVDYLTRIEALRVSIGLEAYAQRDPLVQYKSRASEMFQSLLEDIRSVVIGRLFANQRRPTLEALAQPEQEQPSEVQKESVPVSGKKKRKRH